MNARLFVEGGRCNRTVCLIKVPTSRRDGRNGDEGCMNGCMKLIKNHRNEEVLKSSLFNVGAICIVNISKTRYRPTVKVKSMNIYMMK